MTTMLRLNQINIGPSIALGRRGCFLENGKRPYTNDYYDGTPFEKHFKSLDLFSWHDVRNFIKENFPDIISVCRKIYLNLHETLNDNDKKIIKFLKECKIVTDDLKLIPNIESFGNLFECIVGYALFENQIQLLRETKIKYPFPNKPYDPDGQLYDILAALDLTKLIWIECKKPLYLSNDNPLGNVISKVNIEKFIRRAYFLKPDIAVYLVDTKDDYKEKLRSLLKPEFLTTGNYVEHFEDSDSIIARLNGFIYFNRVFAKSNKLFFTALKNSINQVLYDATRINGNNQNFHILK
jgi:hypothetical protein